jgi:alpha-D-ribose 1-methylphosphonate 5-triphosphate synthase subunit PhnL
MKKLKTHILYGSIGASTGLAGFAPASVCRGGDCTSCWGCVGVGLGVLLMILYNNYKRIKEAKNGMAEKID